MATQLEVAWSEGKEGATCPILGTTCEAGPVLRLPAVNALLQGDIRKLHGEQYAARVAEVNTPETLALIQRVRERGRTPKKPAAADGNGDAVEELARAFRDGWANARQENRERRERLGPDWEPIVFSKTVKFLTPLVLTVVALCVFRYSGDFESLGFSNLAWGFVTDRYISWLYSDMLTECKQVSREPTHVPHRGGMSYKAMPMQFIEHISFRHGFC
jgi:hypothetical protein